MTPVTLAALLALILILLAAAMLWQESRRRRQLVGPTYVVEDAVASVHPRLVTASRLTTEDVRIILEWEIAHLQRTEEGIAGGDGTSIASILEHTDGRYGWEEIEEVLNLETEYLIAIGAVGKPVESE